MTIYKTSVRMDHTNLECDLCGSEDIVETVEGYVCRTCGIVQTLQKLQYDQPYKADVLQHARRLGSTQIGNKRERLVSPHSRTLKRLSKYNKINDNEKLVIAKAHREITRILNSLGLGEYNSLRDIALINFKEIRAKLRPGSKFRNVKKLVAIILYFRFKMDNISVTNVDIFENTELFKKEFNDFFIQVREFFPNYIVRDRQKYISQKLLKITNHFELEMPFYFFAKKVLYRLWEGIKNTTDNVIAGLCASITVLCEYKEDVKISSICELLNIRMSTIQLQVRKRIFERYGIPGFSTLVRSADLLRKFLVKIGLIEDENAEFETISDGETDGIIQVHLGNVTPIFNPLYEHYLFESFAHNGTLTYTYLEAHNHNKFKRGILKKIKTNGVWLKLALEEYFPSKGPPLVG